MNDNVEFVSYDGRFPNLCSGVLVVRVGRRTLTFDGYKNDPEHDVYPKFWCSGGSVSFDEDWSETVVKGPWDLEYEKKHYPEDILEMLPKILETMNEHVPYGCCGGCV